MKKLLIALFSLLFIFPSFGADKLAPKSTTLKTVLEYFIPDLQTRGNTLATYHAFVKENGSGITAAQLNQVCNVGGLDHARCTALIRALGEQFTNACDNNTNSPDCIKLFKKVNTQIRQGTALAQAWGKTKKNDTIVCEDEKSIRKAWNDDWMSCYSVENPTINYEFQFDDLFESNDADTEKGLIEGICNIFDYEHGYHGTLKYYWCQKNSSRSGLAVPKDQCEKINAVAKEFGWKAYSWHVEGRPPSFNDGYDTCRLNLANDRKEIINEYDGIIDNYVYSSGKDQTQLQAASSLDESIRMYAQTRLGATPITSFSCDKSHRVSSHSMLTEREDILTCRINGKRVDFVFDDLTNSTVLWGSAIIKGSQQAMGCRAMGGIFDGEQCADLTESMCEQVAALNLSDCPDCKAAYWDKENKICMLPASNRAKNIKTGIRIVSNTGVAAVALVATFTTGGGALMITAASVATLAAAVSDGAKIVQDFDASDWVVEMNQIQTPEQADAFLRKHLNEIMGADHLVEQRRNGVDEMLNRVLSKASDTYFKELVSGCIAEPQEGEVYYDTSLSTCALNPNNGKNTTSTVVRWADGVQFIAGFVMIVAGLAQTAKTVSYRTEQIIDKIDDLKNTGWIRQNGQWVNQTTGEVANSLPKGVPGWDPNSALRGGGRWRGLLYGNGNTGSFTKKADLIRWITENRVDKIISTVWNPNWAVVAGGVANIAVSHSPENPANVKIPERNNSGGAIPVALVVPGNEVPGNEVPGNEVPGNEVPGNEVPGDKVPGNGEPGGEEVVVVPEPSRNVTPHATKKKANTALIATAAIAGTVGAGWLIGGLIGKDNDKKSSDTSSVPQINPELERLMQNAGGVIGNVNGSDIKLIPLSTTVDSYAPIIDINGYAVVVVDYRGYKLPYYMNPLAMRWEPLLGIGTNGGWFNVYPNPAQTNIPVIDSIAAHLTIKLTPMLVSRYVGKNASDVHFPFAAPSAYQTINAEFPNGVVNVNNGAMTPSDQLLYNNNYQLIKQKLQ